MPIINVGDRLVLGKSPVPVTLSNDAVAAISVDPATGKTIITGTAYGSTLVHGDKVVTMIVVNDGVRPALTKLEFEKDDAGAAPKSLLDKSPEPPAHVRADLDKEPDHGTARAAARQSPSKP